MNILSIDTTTKVASVALKKENNEIIQKSISNEVTHSEKLLPLINELLKEQGLTLKDISVYCAINGPGSFTGIRIGLSTLKAFSYTYNNKIFSLTSNMLLAYKAYNEFIKRNNKLKEKPLYVITLVDAKNNRVYYSLYKIYTNLSNKIEIEEKFNIENDDISVALNNIYGYIKDNNIVIENNIIFAGNSILKYDFNTTKIVNFNTQNIIETYPTPTDTIDAYLNMSDTQSYIYDAFTLDAIYARKSQAERLKNNEQ